MITKMKATEIDIYKDPYNFVNDATEAYYVGGGRIFDGIRVIADYKVMIELLNTFCKSTDFELYQAHIGVEEVNGNYGEYILSIYEGMISVEPTCGSGGYVRLNDARELNYVHKDVSSEFIRKNKDIDMIFFEIDDLH